MKRFCTVPQDLKMGVDGNHYYVHCGAPAVCKVGNWYVCEEHKKHYTDPNKWTAEPLEGAVDAETNES